jgi:hypothetical protein
MQIHSSSMNKAFTLAGYTLLIATLPAMLENMWEVYWGTITAGPQMIGYVLAHADPDATWVRVLWYSSFAGIAYHVFGIFSVALLLLGVRPTRHLKLFCWMFLVLATHGILSALYPYWSGWFERT